MKTALFIALGIVAAGLSCNLDRRHPKAHGIGSYPICAMHSSVSSPIFSIRSVSVPTLHTAFFKLWGTVPDEQIPGTLNVGHTVPTLIEAFIFISVIQVDVTTAHADARGGRMGSWFGASVVAAWPAEDPGGNGNRPARDGGILFGEAASVDARRRRTPRAYRSEAWRSRWG